MTLTDRYARLPLTQIIVKPDRQRKSIYDESGEFINKDGLLEDIRTRGVINPLIINAQYELVAGERRLEASRTCGLPDAPVRFVEDLSPEEGEILELSENVKRTDLPWRDECAAVARLHALYLKRNVGWTLEDTARAIGGYGNIGIIMRVARDIGHPSIAGATSIRQAWNVLTRKDERTKADAAADIALATADIFEEIEAPNVPSLLVDFPLANPAAGGTAPGLGEGGTGPSQSTGEFEPLPGTLPVPPEPGTTPPQDSILLASFLDWAPTYSGPRFNLIHCDFPYSIGVFEGPMSGRDRWETYDDARDTGDYDSLIRCLCSNLDRLMAPSAHLVFWLPADVAVQARTIALFGELAPSLEFWPKPLVWAKTDNVGILSDPKRKPRHVYETALVAAREDRLIAQATSDFYGSPTDKQHHPSTKPEPMLRYFFQMFVDEHTRLLDPTCGSGSALRAAESLGAGLVLGLETSEEHHGNAVKALKVFRAKRLARDSI